MHPANPVPETPQSELLPHPAASDDRSALSFAFRLYKSTLSPLLHALSPSRCLYLPTCSEYAYVAIRRFGPFRGSWLALRRFAYCHPWGKGGYDPVPAETLKDRQSASGSSSSASKGADHLP